MNINERHKVFEKLLSDAPEVLTHIQVARWTPCDRSTVYQMVMLCKIFWSPFESHLYSLKKREAPSGEDAFVFWRRERDWNPRVLAHKLISRNTIRVTIRPSASLIFEKYTDFSAFLLPICQIFRKSDRKVIETEVLSSLIIAFYYINFMIQGSLKINIGIA